MAIQTTELYDRRHGQIEFWALLWHFPKSNMNMYEGIRRRQLAHHYSGHKVKASWKRTKFHFDFSRRIIFISNEPFHRSVSCDSRYWKSFWTKIDRSKEQLETDTTTPNPFLKGTLVARWIHGLMCKALWSTLNSAQAKPS